MLMFLAAAAAMSAATTLYSTSSANKAGVRNANAASKAEGEAIVRERLNKTVSNSYTAAFSQMQLALKKRQLSQQGADISAASLAAHGDADTAIAATGSIGASTQSVVADITQKSDAAQHATADAYANAVDNYNSDLEMLVVNTDQSAPQVRQNTYNGPSGGAMLGGALLTGLTQFVSSYAMQKMSLGLGASPATNVPSQIGSQYSLAGMGARFGS